MPDSVVRAPPVVPSWTGETAESLRLLVESITDYAIFLLDLDGRVVSWNPGAERIKGYRAEEIIGQSFERFYPPDRLLAGWPREELRRAAAHGRYEEEGWRLRKDGTRFWASVVITALRDPDGELQGYGKVTRDLTERRWHEEQLRRSEEQLRLLFEAVKDYALFMLDPQGGVLSWNAGAADITGFTADAVLGRHFSMFFTPADVAAGRPTEELARALTDGRVEVEGLRMRADGSTFWANVVITPVRDDDGVHRGFAKVTRDLSSQRRLLELEQTSRRMNEFIAMLAHELRNPLAPIRNATSLLRLQPDLPPLVARMTEMVDRQTRQLSRLVDDLLDVGRVATGKISLQREDLDWRDVVRATAEAIRPLAEAKRLQLHLELPEAVPMRGDGTRLAQVMHNLLSNAVRYTPEGGQVWVSAHRDAGRVLTRVRDNGRGIAPAALDRIFELFGQEPEVARDPADSGLGLGLTLARTLAELHGGRLTASSPGHGQGATFELVLPCLPGPAPVPAAPAVPGATARPVAVLVVDDNRDSADSMALLLRQMGHAAEAAYTAREAVTLARQSSPQLVLLDLNMPGEDGYQAIGALRAACEQATCIVAMTGYGQHADRERTARAGFDDHLTKPVAGVPLARVLWRAAALSDRTAP
jgi:PAS domain S-box-containing protein